MLFGILSSDSVRALLFFQTRQAVDYTRHNRVTCCPKAALVLTAAAAAAAVVGPSFAGFVHISEMSRSAMSRLVSMCEAGQADVDG